MQSRRYTIIYKYEKEHWWYKGRRFLLKKLLETMNLSMKVKILDIGCGGGFTLFILKKFGIVFGVDIEKKSIDYCKKRGFKNIKLVKEDYKLPFNNNFFNVVTCLDVLEHVKYDHRYLKEINRVLEKKGHLIVFAPAFSILWGELDLRSKHYRRYTQDGLKKILYDCGYIIEQSFYFNFIFFLPILLIRLVQKIPFLRKNNWGIDPIIESQFINKIIAAIFLTDVYLSKQIHPPFGVSLCIVALKKE